MPTIVTGNRAAPGHEGEKPDGGIAEECYSRRAATLSGRRGDSLGSLGVEEVCLWQSGGLDGSN